LTSGPELWFALLLLLTAGDGVRAQQAETPPAAPTMTTSTMAI
jgi:hypothetical protein